MTPLCWTGPAWLCYVALMNDGSGFQKRRKVLEMLDAGLVMLHLDPRAPEVVVPQRFKTDPVLRLNIAYGFRLPALEIGAEGIYAVLSFDRQNFGCTLPWASIFAVTRPDFGHDGIVWPESVPPELRASFSRAGVSEPTRLRTQPAPRDAALTRAPRDAAPPDEAPPDNVRPLFVVHEGGRAAEPEQADAAPAPADEPAAAEPEAPRRRGHLTLVKG